MKTISARAAKNEFASILEASRSEPVIVTKHDREVAALISIEELQRIPKYRELLAMRLRSVGPGPDIAPHIGAARGLFATPKDVDDFIRKERESW